MNLPILLKARILNEARKHNAETWWSKFNLPSNCTPSSFTQSTLDSTSFDTLRSMRTWPGPDFITIAWNFEAFACMWFFPPPRATTQVLFSSFAMTSRIVESPTRSVGRLLWITDLFSFWFLHCLHCASLSICICAENISFDSLRVCMSLDRFLLWSTSDVTVAWRSCNVWNMAVTHWGVWRHLEHIHQAESLLEVKYLATQSSWYHV